MRFAGEQIPWRHYGPPVSSSGFEKRAAEAGMDSATYARYVLGKEAQSPGELPESLVEAARYAENDDDWGLPGLLG